MEFPNCLDDAGLLSCGRLPSCFVATQLFGYEVYRPLHLLDGPECIFLHLSTVRLAKDGCHVPRLPVAGHRVPLHVIRVSQGRLRCKSSLQSIEGLGMLLLPLRGDILPLGGEGEQGPGQLRVIWDEGAVVTDHPKERPELRRILGLKDCMNYFNLLRVSMQPFYHKYAFSVWGRRVTPAVFGPQVYPGPIVCVLKDGLLSMTNGPPLLVCHWTGYTVICDNSPQSKSH